MREFITDLPNDRVGFLADILITAAEGGINYWAITFNYEWSDDKPGLTRVQILERGSRNDERWVDINTIELGIRRIVGNEVKINDRTKQDLWLAWGSLDAGEVDAGDADCIVQAALFGTIVFG